MKLPAEDYNSAKKFYESIGSALSSALGNEEVAFTRIGFNHLLRKGRIPRPVAEQKNRFTLLKYAKPIIEDERSYVVKRRGNAITFWTFYKEIDGRSIKVVVSQIKAGKKQFLSIMEDRKKQKEPH